MQNPVFIQFKDFLKRSNSMVSIPTENIRIRKYKTFQIFMRLAHMLIPQTPRQIMKYFRVINSKLCTQYQSDFLVFSHARTYCPICAFYNLINSHQISTDCLQSNGPRLDSNLDCLGMSEICESPYFWLGIRQLYADDTYIFLSILCVSVTKGGLFKRVILGSSNCAQFD